MAKNSMSQNNPTPLEGVLIVHKPKDATSHDAVATVRRILKNTPEYHHTKVGHAGTLDPFATGVLLILLGSANRLMEYIHLLPKTYRANLRLGATSTTGDPTGEITQTNTHIKPSTTEIEEAIKKHTGEQTQIPPAYSAVKYKGEKLYNLARQGTITDEITKARARKVTVHSITINNYNYPNLEITVTCGSGTYIRTLAEDIAKSLSTNAYLTDLHRQNIGKYTEEHAINLSEITSEIIEENLQSSVNAVEHLPRITVNEENVAQLKQGRSIPVPQSEFTVPQENIAIFTEKEQLLGIGTITNDPLEPLLSPRKILSN